MRFAHASSAKGQSLLREQQRREREASALLRTRLPGLNSLRLDFTFRDAGPFTPVPQVTVMHPAARAYFVFPCPYSDCDGKFDLSASVTGMVDARQDSCDGHLHCNGRRFRDTKGRSPCDLTLQYRLEAHWA
jgi:hypothetical protein